MEEKRGEAGTAPAVGAESPASEPSSRRRSGALKRKNNSNLGASNSSSVPSKRVTREKASLSHPPIHNGPLTRARQGPNNLAASASALQGGAAAPAKKLNEQAAAAAAEELSKKSELVALEAAMEAELEAIRSRGANAHVVPSHCGWFSWTKVHPIEERTLPSFFNGKSEARTPDVYMEIRNWIMKKFHSDPNTQIELKDISELEVGDLEARQEVMEFLDHWGLINFHPFPLTDSVVPCADNDGAAKRDSLVEKLFRFETPELCLPVVPKTNLTTPAVPSGFFPESAIAEELARAEGPAVEYHCNFCSADCSRKRYHCQKQADFAKPGLDLFSAIMEPHPTKSWSIHTRPEIVAKYEILERVGAGAYSDVYRARRRSDEVVVALKEVHDYQSAFREIEALQVLRNSPNVVVMHEYFWREDGDEDAVLVLEYMRTDLAAVIREAKKEGRPIGVGEVKRWMVQILCGVDVCHRNMIVHRDLKPSNLLVSDDGVLKLADFGQARILLEPGYIAYYDPQQYEQKTVNQESTFQHPEVSPEAHNLGQEVNEILEQDTISKEEYFRQLDEVKAKSSIDETDKETNFHDGDVSCLATCSTSDMEDDPFKSSYSYEAEEGGDDRQGALTSCVGTRWFRAPELLYGSTNYGLEIDLWSLGCIFAELFNLEPLFPGTADIDQLSRIFSVLGNLTEEVWPGCAKLPDYRTISFGKVENPVGLEACLPNRSPDEISLVKKLACYDPASRATAMELLQDNYFSEEPLPAPISELRVPLMRSGQEEDSPRGWYDYNEMGSDSDFEDFGPVNVTSTSTGFSIQFP